MTDFTLPQPSPAVAALTAELVDIGGQLTSTVAGMLHFQDSGRSTATEPIPVILDKLLGGILADHLSERFGEDAISAAAQIVRAAGHAIESDLYVVSPELLAELDEAEE